MSRAPLVSFVVVNWHAEEATARCVESIRMQRDIDPRCVEIRVIDNGSTPESLAALERLGVPLVASLRNTGFAGGANLGITRARGRYVAIVNNDAVLADDWTAQGLSLLEDDDAVGLVGGADLAWDGAWPPGDSGAERVTAPRVDPSGGFTVSSSQPLPERDVLALNGSNLLGRTDVLARLRGFDPAFFAYYEDIDLCARVWATGRRVVFSPDMRVWHRRNLSSDRMPYRKSYLAHRNHMRLVAKHFPEPRWRAGVRQAALARIATAVSGRASGPDVQLGADERRAQLAAGAWGLVNGPRLARTRRDTIARGEHYAGFVAHAMRDMIERTT